MADLYQGDVFVTHVKDMFDQNAISAYLTDRKTCTDNLDWSKAFTSRVRTAIKDHAEISYLATQYQAEENCAVFFQNLTKILETREVQLTRECHLWLSLLNLKCDDIDSFGTFFSDMNTLLIKLKNDKSVALTDDNLLRVLLHRAIDVPELETVVAKFLSNTKKSATALFIGDVNQAYRTHKSSEKNRDKASSSSAKARKAKLEAAKDSSTASTSTTDTAKATTIQFPRNLKGRWPEDQYMQMKEWCEVAMKHPRTAADTKWLSDFTYKFPRRSNKPPRDGGRDGDRGGDRGGYKGKNPRDGGGSYNRRRDDDGSSRSGRRGTRYEDRGSSRSRSRSPRRRSSRSPSRSRDRRRPSSSRDRGDRGSESTNRGARRIVRTDQFNGASEYARNADDRRRR